MQVSVYAMLMYENYIFTYGNGVRLSPWVMRSHVTLFYRSRMINERVTLAD
jgi:hypothetical protein